MTPDPPRHPMLDTTRAVTRMGPGMAAGRTAGLGPVQRPRVQLGGGPPQASGRGFAPSGDYIEATGGAGEPIGPSVFLYMFRQPMTLSGSSAYLSYTAGNDYFTVNTDGLYYVLYNVTVGVGAVGDAWALATSDTFWPQQAAAGTITWQYTEVKRLTAGQNIGRCQARNLSANAGTLQSFDITASPILLNA